MTVNLSKNRESIVAAWKDVLDDKTNTDWALFAYEGQTNDLKVVGTGNGGLEELQEDLNTGKIMYAFVRMPDPKTSLIKYILINWQGEGAPVLRKGTCANHIRDIAKLLSGAHLTINARMEDDVEKDRILEKLSMAGSAYSFNEPRAMEDVQKGPVGTAYTRTIPAKEINAMERDNFWRKEEEEEKKRIEIEKERKRLEVVKAEEERRLREEKEHNLREQRIIEQPTSPIKSSPNSPVVMKTSPIKVQSDFPSRATTDAELMRQQRNQEAKELIGSRVGVAKAVFSQNSTNIQYQSQKTTAPIKPVRNSIAQRINSLNNQQTSPKESPEHHKEESTIKEINNDEIIQQENITVAKTIIAQPFIASAATLPIVASNSHTNGTKILTSSQNPTDAQFATQQDEYDDSDDQFSTIKRSPHSKSIDQPMTPVEEASKIVDTKVQQQNTAVEQQTTGLVTYTTTANTSDLATEEDILYQDIMSDMGLKARALYDYQAADESEITFDPGDVITHIDQIDEAWWQGLGPDGSYGLFPANYVELIH